MNETCDRCGPSVLAAVRAERAERALYLCRHCGNQLWPALTVRGWIILPAAEHAFAPQAT
ncbi:hypothetical protein [Kribbella kalugense]|uniref:hypothetical protein n=1 Tax=Kribbella kalugense TaxID=2512221 RepID=UPI001064A465|nr:hypothetical protein [Kribbella kalugense]